MLNWVKHCNWPWHGCEGHDLGDLGTSIARLCVISRGHLYDLGIVGGHHSGVLWRCGQAGDVTLQQ